MSPSSTASSTPVAVIVCGTLQSPAVNVIEAGATVPSVRSELLTPIVTSAVGWVFSTIVKLAVPPASVVTSPATGATVMPATSSSMLVTATSLAFFVSYLGSALAAAAVTIVYAMSSSSTSSLTPVTVIVRGTFQLA